jgi:uncharacterized membrane protein
MGTLTVWKFDGHTGADQAEKLVEGLAAQQLIELQDAATVSWEPGAKKPKTRQLHNVKAAGATSGMLWGMLFGLIFFVPLLGAAVGAASGALAGSLADVGIDDRFIKSVREQVTPGTSALFLMSSNAVMDKVKQAFDDQGLHPDLIQSNLSDEQESELREMIAG